MKVLVTCPPMLALLGEFTPLLEKRGFEVIAPEVVQILPEEELVELVPGVEGWIVGDDPASRRVLEAGKEGRLRALVKWGVGVDNVDFEAARELGIPATNTPAMFGDEVADVALGYAIALARETFRIDRGVRAGGWPKPRGISLADKTAAVVGFGSIGRELARRLLASKMRVAAYDPQYRPAPGLEEVTPRTWPEGLEEADFLFLCCALTPENRGMVGARIFAKVKPSLRLVNVARGPLIDEQALVQALVGGRVHSAALDVFEVEPLPADSALREFDQVIFGSHNGSNTAEGVRRASLRAIDLLSEILGSEKK